MILKIDYDEKDVISQSNGRILIKIHFYSQYAKGCHLATTKGETKEEFDRNKGLGNRTVFVGTNGGISFG